MARRLQVRLLGAAIGLAIVSLPSFAHARPDARTLTCSEVQALLEREGAATISTSDTVYERYVRDTSACPGTRVARRATIATQDTQQCEVRICERRVLRRSTD